MGKQISKQQHDETFYLVIIIMIHSCFNHNYKTSHQFKNDRLHTAEGALHKNTRTDNNY